MTHVSTTLGLWRAHGSKFKNLSTNSVKYGAIQLSPWVPNRTKSLIEGRNISTLLLYPEVGLVFNRIKKSGNSSVALHLNNYITSSLVEIKNESYQNYERAKREAMSGRSAFWPLFFGKLEGYRFFTVVRNPYTRLLSAFLQKRSSYERLSKQYWGAVPGFMEKNVVMGFEMFLSHLAHAGVHGDRHWTPQCELLAFPAQFYDSVVKLEHLDEGLNSLLVESRPVLGRGDFALPHPSTAVTNQRSSEHLDQFYTQKSLRLVRKLYARDFDEFNYASDL